MRGYSVSQQTGVGFKFPERSEDAEERSDELHFRTAGLLVLPTGKYNRCALVKRETACPLSDDILFRENRTVAVTDALVRKSVFLTHNITFAASHGFTSNVHRRKRMIDFICWRPTQIRSLFMILEPCMRETIESIEQNYENIIYKRFATTSYDSRENRGATLYKPFAVYLIKFVLMCKCIPLT